jgi:hypothetical protein
VAVEAWYDGPCCVRSAVDNRHDKRLLSAVLDRHPRHDDLRAFLGRLQSAWEGRDLTLRGVTTDGSPRYPDPLREVFGEVPHQIGACHGVKEIVKAV